MSARQDLIICWVAMGMNRKQIAELIGLSLKCIEWHLAQIKRILGFNDPARLTHWAISHKLVKLNQIA